MRTLRPQHLQDSYFSDIERQLRAIFFEELIEPLIAIIKEHSPLNLKIENATTSALTRALLSGRVQYKDNKFTGEFSAAIVKDLRSIGAVFLKRQKAYRLAQALVPTVVLDAAIRYEFRAKGAHDAIEAELNRAMHYAIVDTHHVDALSMVSKVDAGWRASAARLEVKPELTVVGKHRLAANYSEALSLPIKNWLQEQILKLRQDVKENAEAGYRFDSLINIVRQRGNVSKSKAKFLARQETGLFMAQYRRQRFLDVGVRKYRWSTSHDVRVRPEPGLSAAERIHAGNHRILDQQEFTYENKAPARYMSIGKPCNPGEDYNCRCVDIPLIA